LGLLQDAEHVGARRQRRGDSLLSRASVGTGLRNLANAGCSRSVSAATGDLPHGCGGGSEFVGAGSALGSALAVLRCPLGAALALLEPPHRRSSVWASARWRVWSASAAPLRPWRALLVQVSRRAPGPGSGAGPRCQAQAVVARSSGAVVVSALQCSRIVRAALVTVSAACRTWVRSPPAQPAT